MIDGQRKDAVATNLGSQRIEGFQQEALAIGDGTTVFVGASVQRTIEELLEQIAIGPVQLDAVEACVHRVGVRLSPFGRLFDMHPYAQEAEAWLSLAEALNARSLAYVHLSDQLTIGAEAIPAGFATQWRQAYQGTLIAAGGFTRILAEAVLAKGDLDLVAFGRPFIANPDLVERMKHDWPLAEADRATFYGIDGSPTRGYTDYPTAGVTPVRASQP